MVEDLSSECKSSIEMRKHTGACLRVNKKNYFIFVLCVGYVMKCLDERAKNLAIELKEVVFKQFLLTILFFLHACGCSKLQNCDQLEYFTKKTALYETPQAYCWQNL